MGSWCVGVVVVSRDEELLGNLAHEFRRGRLLLWGTRLVVVTQLDPPRLTHLLHTYWTFAMMNTLMLNNENSRYTVVTEPSFIFVCMCVCLMYFNMYKRSINSLLNAYMWRTYSERGGEGKYGNFFVLVVKFNHSISARCDFTNMSRWCVYFFCVGGCCTSICHTL